MRFRPCSRGRLDGFTASAWRGGMGHALRRAVCRTGAATCGGCPHLFDCDYSLSFETPRPPEDAFLSTDVTPHPFGLLARDNGVGEQEVTLSLYGSGTRFLAAMAQGLEAAGAGGIGPDRVRLGLEEVMCERPVGTGAWRPLAEAAQGETEPARWPAPPARCRIRLLTPLRLRRQGEYIGPQKFQFADLADNLVRRVALLCRYFAEPLDADFRQLRESAAGVNLERARLRWHELTRYSSRQDRAIAMGGVMGEFEARVPDQLWPYLWLGQFVQAGKGTSLGLGHLEVQATPCGS